MASATTKIKRDDVKQSWEETEFPLVCETCLGDNPYVRMTKEPAGKKCQVCERPFTVFAWQAGTKGRLKRVEICRSCAQAKNVCQVCIYDLRYGLPVKVRDRILRETGSTGAAAQMAVPQSNANRAWYTAQQERAIASGESSAGAEANALAHAKLSEMARMEPRYERNLPKLCSFFAAGECDRGSSCPFRHEMPRDRNDPLSKQNTRDRFYGTSDPVANKILGRKRKQEEMEQQKQQERGEDGYNRARATLYLRFQRNDREQPFPIMTEGDIRDQFYSFGEIVSVRVQAEKGQAFVEYTQPEATELAIASMNKKQLLGCPMYVAWAHAPKHGEQQQSQQQQGPQQGPQQGRGNNNNSRYSNNRPAAAAPTAVQPMAPPGGFSKSATSSAKSALPAGIQVKPPPEVMAMAAASRKQQQQQGGGANRLSSVPRPASSRFGSVPRPANRRGQQPMYPSADPNRLGSHK